MSKHHVAPVTPSHYPFLNHDLSREVRLADLMGRLTLDEKIGFLNVISPGVSRLGIKPLQMENEALHGIMRPGPATVFPQAIGLAAMFNADLMLRLSTAISDEARAMVNTLDEETKLKLGHCYAFFSPVVNMARDPRWGRTQETYGEDPCLTARMGVAFVRGLQGNDPDYLKAVATPKHFSMNNEEHNRFECNARVSERALHEYYLPAFRACLVEAKAHSIMAAYNAINGTPCHANRKLLTEIVRNQWGFDGYVVSDCGGVSRLFDKHHCAKTAAEAAALALNAGLDVEVGSDMLLSKHTKDNLRHGLVTEARLNEACERLLRILFRLGVFDPPGRVPFSTIPGSRIGCRKHARLALQAARESIVLLKNTPVKGRPLLPFNPKTIRSIAVIGNNAHECLFGHYSGTPVHPAISSAAGLQTYRPRGVTVRTVKWRYYRDDEFAPFTGELLEPAAGDRSKKGFYAEYFDNCHLQGKPVGARVDPQINFNWLWVSDPFVRTDNYSVRWTATLRPNVSGVYKFKQRFNSGLRFYVNDRLVEDLWRDFIHGRDRKLISVPLEAGKEYRIRIEHFATDKYPARKSVQLEWNQPLEDAARNFSDEVNAARECDAVVAVLGISTRYECEGMDRKDIGLPREQIEMLKRIIKVNPRTVVILEAGSSMDIRSIAAQVPAIMISWYPGERGGQAIADVLFGRFNPAGRLPLTFYRSLRQLPAFDDYEPSRGRTYMFLRSKPLYPFGHGLSYTNFKYANLRLKPAKLMTDTLLTVSVDIRNTGKRDGDEVVQFYARNPKAPAPRALRAMKAFRRVRVRRGCSRLVTAQIALRDLAYYNESECRFVLEPGTLTIEAGASSADIRVRTCFTVDRRLSFDK